MILRNKVSDCVVVEFGNYDPKNEAKPSFSSTAKHRICIAHTVFRTSFISNKKSYVN